MSQLREVELVSTGVYLPGDPVPFDNLEDILGRFERAPAKTKKIESKLRKIAKNLIGIDQCYYAVDPKTGKLTENNTSMATKAIRNALDKTNIKLEEIDCLLYGNVVPDCQTPPTTTLIQEELGIENIAEIEVHSNCTAMSKLLQIALDSIKVGRYQTVLVAYSQLSSAYLMSSYYNQEKLGPENILLRWFLCDGASAMLLKACDKVECGIKLEHVYNLSIGGKKERGMWFDLGIRNMQLPKTYKNGKHHLGQDYRAANDFGPYCFATAYEKLMAGTEIKHEEINHILATLPSRKLWEQGKQEFLKRYNISPEAWYSNVSKTGYAGASAVIIALDEMLSRKLFKPSQRLVSIIFESSKWMIGGFVLKYL